MDHRIVILIIAVLALAVLAVWFWRRMKSKALSVMEYGRSISSDGLFVGETLELTETVCNKSWFPLIAVKMEFYVPAGLTVDDFECNEYIKLTSVFNAPPYSTVTKKHTVTVDKRGKYHLSDVSFSYRKDNYIFDIPLDFYGYPDYFSSESELSADIISTGDVVSRRKYVEDPFFISGIREYRAGDPMRSINFKASARAFNGGVRSMMSNSYDSSRSYDTFVFLDLNRYAECNIHSEAQLEIGLKYACFLFCSAINNGGRFGFCTNSANGSQKFVFLPCESGEMHTKRVLEQFAVIDFYSKRDYSVAALLRENIEKLKPNTDIYLITPYVDANADEMIYLLRGADREIQVINIGNTVKN
ncbi:MAG: DUF58 domain-containing protein [Ruminococcaceae bacterium]|nr:DUF58 domain-containing protein [Oscillospiraceae bacterium]